MKVTRKVGKAFIEFGLYLNMKSNTVICKTDFLDYIVEGRAVCSPEDEFNIDIGANLALARCTKDVLDLMILSKKLLINPVIAEINQLRRKIERLNHKYGLNKSARNGIFCRLTYKITKETY